LWRSVGVAGAAVVFATSTIAKHAVAKQTTLLCIQSRSNHTHSLPILSSDDDYDDCGDDVDVLARADDDNCHHPNLNMVGNEEFQPLYYHTSTCRHCLPLQIVTDHRTTYQQSESLPSRFGALLTQQVQPFNATPESDFPYPLTAFRPEIAKV